MSTRSSSKEAKAETPLAAWQGDSLGAFAQAGQAYMEGVMELNREFARFVQSRLQRDLELGRSLAGCRALSEFTDIQQRWLKETTEQYAAETQKLVELGAQLASKSWGSVRPAEAESSAPKGG